MEGIVLLLPLTGSWQRGAPATGQTAGLHSPCCSPGWIPKRRCVPLPGLPSTPARESQMWAGKAPPQELGAPILQQEQAATTAVCKDFNLPPEPLCSGFSDMKHMPRNTSANHVGCTSPAASSVQRQRDHVWGIHIFHRQYSVRRDRPIITMFNRNPTSQWKRNTAFFPFYLSIPG